MDEMRDWGSAAGGILFLRGEAIEKVKHLSYLGSVPTDGGWDMWRKGCERLEVLLGLTRSHGSSVGTAAALSRIKIAPIATYAIRLAWRTLGKKQPGELDRVKAAFLKRVLGVHETARNRLNYIPFSRRTALHGRTGEAR